MRTLFTLVIAIFTVLVASVPAASAGTWLPPQGIATGPSGFDGVDMLDASLGAGGDAAVVWSTGVQIRPFGGAWSTVTPFPAGVDVGVDASGATTAVYSEVVAGGTHVVASTHTATGWSAPQEIAPPGASTSSLRLAVASDGTAVAFWLQGGGAVQFARRDTGGSWTHGTIPANAGGNLWVSHLPSGGVAVAWQDASSMHVWVAVGTTQAGGFAAEQTAEIAALMALQISPDDTVAVFNWSDGSGLTSSWRERSTHTWQFRKVLIAPNTGPPVQEVGSAAGPDGSIWIDAWRYDANTDHNDLQAFALTPSGAWIGPELVANTGLAIEGGYHHPRIAVMPDGTVITAYKENWELVERARQPSGAWLPPVDLAFGIVNVTDYVPGAILTSPSGDALVIAQEDQCPPQSCTGYAVPFDGAPPRLSVSVPTAGVQGQAVPMSATALDMFSALNPSTTWVFDDGAGPLQAMRSRIHSRRQVTTSSQSLVPTLSGR